MRYTGPKMKLCRREGYNLFGVEKYNLEDNNRKVKRAGKLSEFGIQLRKKQAAKRQYAVSEKQFARYFKRAVRTDRVTGDEMLKYLETRLDSVIFRGNFARTIMQARQEVSHGHFLVNGKKLNIPSYEVKIGDVITIKERLKESTLYKTLVEEFQAFAEKNKAAQLTSVRWLTVDPKNLTITVTALPEKADFDQMIDIQRIVEFYSK